MNAREPAWSMLRGAVGGAGAMGGAIDVITIATDMPDFPPFADHISRPLAVSITKDGGCTTGLTLR